MNEDENIHGNHICQYVERTWHGLYAVELLGDLCPLGLGCLTECPHSFDEDRYPEICARLAQAFIDSLNGVRNAA